MHIHLYKNAVFPLELSVEGISDNFEKPHTNFGVCYQGMYE